MYHIINFQSKILKTFVQFDILKKIVKKIENVLYMTHIFRTI